LTLASTSHLSNTVRAGIFDDEANALASALSWWQLAGVDVMVDDAPRGWLKNSASVSNQAHVPDAVAAAQAADVVALPATIEAFSGWIRHPENLSDLGTRRPAPLGRIAGGLMLLTDMPDTEDCEADMLVAGTAGRLLDAMLGAIGRDRASVYLASLAPGRPASGRLAAPLEAELARLARHHIALARPRLVLLLGDATIRAMIGTSLAEARNSIHGINLDGGTLPAIATFHPRFLLQQPARKADAWADLRKVMEILNA